MQCNQCKIDMYLEKVENDIFNFKCKKCGKTVTKTKLEMEDLYKKMKESNSPK